MQTLVHAPTRRECAVIFTESGYSSIRFNDATVKHHVPASDLFTGPQYEEYLATHPKDKPYLHEVLEVVAKVKKQPRPADESDSEWLAFLRQHAVIYTCTPRKDLHKFIEQYEVATGESLRMTYGKHPGLYVRERGGWANSLHVRWPASIGPVPTGCPAEVLQDTDGTYYIHNTRFIWSLIAREGFRLDP